MTAKIGIRLVMLLVLFMAMSFADSEGWIEQWVQTTFGLITYWAVMIGAFALLIFGIYLPWMRLLSQKNTPIARMMTHLYRKWQHR